MIINPRERKQTHPDHGTERMDMTKQCSDLKWLVVLEGYTDGNASADRAGKIRGKRKFVR